MHMFVLQSFMWSRAIVFTPVIWKLHWGSPWSQRALFVCWNFSNLWSRNITYTWNKYKTKDKRLASDSMLKLEATTVNGEEREAMRNQMLIVILIKGRKWNVLMFFPLLFFVRNSHLSPFCLQFLFHLKGKSKLDNITSKPILDCFIGFRLSSHVRLETCRT